MNSLSATARKLDKVFEIAHIVLGALMIASVVGIALIAAAYLFGWDPDVIGSGYASFEVGFLELEIAEEFAPDKWMILAQVAITLAVTGRLLYDGRRGVVCIREILGPMAEGKPFDSIVSSNLKKLAHLSIRLGILWNVIILAEQVMAVFVYDLPSYLISEKIIHVSGMLEVDLTFLIYWAILMLLSYVFRYGQALQDLSDETL